MGRAKRVLRVQYTTRKYEITKEDIDKDKFVLLLDTRRKIMPGVVTDIFKKLSQDKHFDSPFVVNHKDGKYRLIDGNHRFKATELYLNLNPDNRVEVTLNIYENLSEEDERILFTDWNLGRKQSTNDFVRQYKDTIPIWKIMTKETEKSVFPCKVSEYGGADSIAFYKLVGTYLTGIKPKFQGGFIGHPLKFVDEARELGHSDVTLMTAFMKDFLEAFGPIRGNSWLRTTPFTAIMRLWLDNYKTINKPKMVSYFKLKLVNNAVAIDLSRMSGRGACVYVTEQFRRLLNNSRTQDIFVVRNQEETVEEEN